MRVRRLPLATADLDAIWLYIARDDLDAATSLVARITAKIDQLGAHPYSGRPRPDLAADARSAPVRSYMILYRVVPDAVEIVRVVHGRREVGRLWSGPV